MHLCMYPWCDEETANIEVMFCELHLDYYGFDITDDELAEDVS